MKITVIGASGLIGNKVVDLLTAEGHHVVAASRASGVDVLTGGGLAEALSGADALVDVVNSPSFDDDPVMEFFTKSTTNLVDAAKRAGVGHYVALSIVGVDGLPDSGYMRAKVVQEKIIDDRRRPGACARRADPTDRRRRRCERRRPCGRGRTAGRRREYRRAGKDLVRTDGSRRTGPPR
jgi:uncharacterized protein YbjT (DUF2867 family)